MRFPFMTLTFIKSLFVLVSIYKRGYPLFLRLDYQRIYVS